MIFEEWLESESVVNRFGHVINFSNSAVELARAAWLASREAAEQAGTADYLKARADENNRRIEELEGLLNKSG